MLDSGMVQSDAVLPVKLGRRRGTHSVKCLNPDPKHQRKDTYKKLPGPMGHLARIAAKKKIHASLVFIQAFPLMGRQRDFKPVRKKLIDQVWRAVFDCLDMATRMPTKCFEQIATELNITNSRMSRCVNEVFMLAGLFYSFDSDAFKPDYNSTHGVCFPSMVVVTDKFFEAGGASPELIEKLNNLSDEKLQHIIDAETGQPMSLNSARALRKKWAWDRAYERRKDAARAQKKRAYLASLGSIDERLHHVGKQLLMKDPDYYHVAAPNQLQIDAWAVLKRLNVATIPKGKGNAPPH
jgi:hypothetical protein